MDNWGWLLMTLGGLATLFSLLTWLRQGNANRIARRAEARELEIHCVSWGAGIQPMGPCLRSSLMTLPIRSI